MMTVMSGQNSERLWEREAAGVARRVNAGWWLERFNLILVVSLILFSAVILCLRTFQIAWVETSAPMIALSGIAASAGLLAWIWSRKHYIDKEDAMVRLDDRLHLNNGLSAALARVAPWPVYEAGKGDDGLQWRWGVAVLPGIVAAVLVVAAWFVPVISLKGKEALVTNEPSAWGQMEEWVATLEEEELIDPDSLKEIEEKIEELREKPEEDWFAHSSLEATDTLKDSLGRDIQKLGSDMGTIERDLESLRSFSSEMTDAGREMLLRELDEALQNLAMNGLEINSELARQLSQIDPSQLSQEMMKNLSSAEMQALQKKMCKACDALGSMEGLPALSESQKMMMGIGMMPGAGGLSRGRGDAPLFYGDEEDLGTSRIEKVENLDLSRATPGDLLAVGETEHEDDMEASKAQTGGKVNSNGTGGDAVWRDSLLPDEKAVLKRYFK
tara:strand:- start:301 stop:1629 length:1329 start_codon:yes stop_codon:yes gene_type:complete